MCNLKRYVKKEDKEMTEIELRKIVCNRCRQEEIIGRNDTSPFLKTSIACPEIHGGTSSWKRKLGPKAVNFNFCDDCLRELHNWLFPMDLAK